MTEISISKLKQHPAQKEIYGDEAVDMDLARSIKEKGILQPLIVTEDFTVLSGNRRWKAAAKAGWKVVPVEIKAGLDKLEQESFIIESNLQRQKTPRQLAREAKRLKEIEGARAKERMLLTQNNETGRAASANVAQAGKTEEKGQKGRASAAVGAKLGMGARTVEKLIEVEEKIEELESEGKVEEAKRIEKTLNKKSINAAHAQVKPKPQSEAKPRTPTLPKITKDTLPEIDEGWIRGRQWELMTVIMQKLTGEEEKPARALMVRLMHDTTQTAAIGAIMMAGNNLNFIKSEKLEPYAYIKAIASRLKLPGNGRGTGTSISERNRELIERMIEERS